MASKYSDFSAPHKVNQAIDYIANANGNRCTISKATIQIRLAEIANDKLEAQVKFDQWARLMFQVRG